MRFFICLTLICFIFVDSSSGWRIFWKGRKHDGNLGDPSKSSQLLDEDLPEEQWFDQALDNFDPRSNKTFKQRYWVNGKYYKEGGPIFLMIGGEAEARAKWMVEGAWIKYAKQFNALCFQLEHRYYGKSRPTSDLSTENLLFLASEQALVDLARFIQAMNKQYNLDNDAKWIAFGGSYPGTLAAWMRVKFPHLVHGSISSSGPLLAKVDFYEYYQVVEQSLGTYSKECVTAVRRAMNQFDLLLKHMIGQRTVDESFKLCDPVEKSIENPLDIANLFESLAGNFAGVVQYNKDNSPHAKITIDEVCDIMVNASIGVPVDRLAAVNSLILASEDETCLDYKYDKMIDEMKNTSWESEAASGGRQWTYQTCTEFGFYQTSESEQSLFGSKFPTKFFVDQCTDIFGKIYDAPMLNRATNDINLFYGGLNPSTTNVIYIHGSIDPWHALGLTKPENLQTPTIYIEGTAHCANMYEPTPKDPPQLVEARNIIEEFIREILH